MIPIFLRSIFFSLFILISGCTKCSPNTLVHKPSQDKPPVEQSTASSMLADTPTTKDTDCSVSLSGDGQVNFSLNSLIIPAHCASLKVKLRHTGKYPKTADGHNIIISQKKDMIALVKLAASSKESDYIPKSYKVVASSLLIGGGEETEFVIDKGKLKQDEEYVFFCSFPGHFESMQGEMAVEH